MSRRLALDGLLSPARFGSFGLCFLFVLVPVGGLHLARDVAIKRRLRILGSLHTTFGLDAFGLVFAPLNISSLFVQPGLIPGLAASLVWVAL